MKVIDCQQGSYEWFQARLGRVTASEVGDAIHFLKRGENKGKEGATRANYRASIVAEILSGVPSDTFVSKYMIHGTETEPRARTAYELKFGVLVDTVGFVVHPTIDRAGASPDGLINEDGGLEIKAPKTETHLRYMEAGILPPDYEPQVMWNIACCGREWWDFMSYDDRIPERYRIFTRRVYRDDKRIAAMEEGVRQFFASVDEAIAKLNELNPEVPLRERLQQSADTTPITGDFETDMRSVADSMFGDERMLQA